MATVFDVASCILAEHGKMTAMKLQKLAYYAQAWSLVWDEAPLFPNRIEAWANGPVCPDLYSAHKGVFEVSADNFRGDPTKLNTQQLDVVHRVLAHYGEKTAQWLSDLTHAESPWKYAREGLPPGERSGREITQGAMAEYYGSL